MIPSDPNGPLDKSFFLKRNIEPSPLIKRLIWALSPVPKIFKLNQPGAPKKTGIYHIILGFILALFGFYLKFLGNFYIFLGILGIIILIIGIIQYDKEKRGIKRR